MEVPTPETSSIHPAVSTELRHPSRDEYLTLGFKFYVAHSYLIGRRLRSGGKMERVLNARRHRFSVLALVAMRALRLAGNGLLGCSCTVCGRSMVQCMETRRGCMVDG